MKNPYLAVLREEIDKTENFHKMEGSNPEFPILSRKINEVEAVTASGVIVLRE